ncbi:MAG: hypothetical protein QOD59_402 [Mycobacterium sp.]|jgi:hypothetical protein|nr:hypothetical protein [Mycobacterium sp.]
MILAGKGNRLLEVADSRDQGFVSVTESVVGASDSVMVTRLNSVVPATQRSSSERVCVRLEIGGG